MTLARIIRDLRLAMLALAGLLAPANAAPRATTGVAVIGDSLVCPKPAPGEIAACGDRISAVSLLNLHAYASCLATHHRHEADLATRAYARWRDRDPLRALVADDRTCMPKGGARMSAILLAGALAEHLPGWRARLHTGFAPMDRPADMIHCLIAANPRLPLAVLRSAPMSEDEQTAVRRLVPALPSCLPSGIQLETNRAALRAMLVLALFQTSTPEPALPERPLIAGLETPLRLAAPRLAMVPLATVGGQRIRTANATVPSWTAMPEGELHHGDYGHPDLLPVERPEDQLADTANGPFKDDLPPSDPLKASFPGASSDAPAPR